MSALFSSFPELLNVAHKKYKISLFKLSSTLTTVQRTAKMATTYVANPKHVIEGHDVDQQKLLNLLRYVYGTTDDGENNFRVEVRYRSPWNNSTC